MRYTEQEYCEPPTDNLTIGIALNTIIIIICIFHDDIFNMPNCVIYKQ